VLFSVHFDAKILSKSSNQLLSEGERERNEQFYINGHDDRKFLRLSLDSY
jgi:hypothetical protein